MPRWPKKDENTTQENAAVATAAPEVSVATGNVPDMVNRRIMSVRERQNIEKQLATYRRVSEASSAGYALGTQEPGNVIPEGMRYDTKRMNDQQRDLLRSLQAGSPPPVSAKERDILWARAKHIQEELRDKQVLETLEELHVTKKDNPAYHTALDKARMRPKWEGMIKEYQNIMRTLEPDNETAECLDRLRKPRN